MKGMATQAANDTLGATERGYIGEQIAAMGRNINEMSTQTVFQDYKLLNGEVGGDFDGKLALTFQVCERAEDTVSVDLDAVNVNALFAGSTSIQNIEATTGTLNNLVAASAAAVTQIGIEVGDSKTFIAVSGATSAAITTGTGLAFAENVVAAINSAGVEGLSAVIARDEDGIATGISVINANLNDEVKVGYYNAGFDDKTDGGVTTVAVATGTGPAEGQGALNVTDWTADQFRGFMADVDKAITAMAERVNTVGIAQSSLSLREVTLSQSISANSSAASRIMDTDFAKEQSESIRLQILQQTATSAFAQANSGPQSVLGFLR
jgi:flagellin-like hook-associated protein FlgL